MQTNQTQPQQPPPASSQLTQQQLKRKRRQKILARTNPGSEIVQPQHLSTQAQSQPNAPNEDRPFSAYQLFKTSQAYQVNKKFVEWTGIVFGIFAAILHLFTSQGQLAFIFALSLISALTVYIQITHSYKISKYTNKPNQNPLIQKISNIKQLEIANKVLKLQAALSPITKVLAAYFLTVVIYGLVFEKTA